MKPKYITWPIPTFNGAFCQHETSWWQWQTKTQQEREHSGSVLAYTGRRSTREIKTSQTLTMISGRKPPSHILPSSISEDQQGFIKNRFIGYNTRLIPDVIYYSDLFNIDGAISISDFKKAFVYAQSNTQMALATHSSIGLKLNTLIYV